LPFKPGQSFHQLDKLIIFILEGLEEFLNLLFLIIINAIFPGDGDFVLMLMVDGAVVSLILLDDCLELCDLLFIFADLLLLVFEYVVVFSDSYREAFVLVVVLFRYSGGLRVSEKAELVVFFEELFVAVNLILKFENSFREFDILLLLFLVDIFVFG
jgi:hypothetical protein